MRKLYNPGRSGSALSMGHDPRKAAPLIAKARATGQTIVIAGSRY